MKLLSLIFTLHLALASYPGIRTSINVDELNSLKSVYIPQFLQNLTSTPIPSETFSFLALLIPCKVTLTNITTLSATVDLTGTQFVLNPSTNQVHLQISQLNMKVQANYKYNYPIFASGTAEVSFNNTNLDLPVMFFIKNGVLNAKAYSSKLDRDSVSVQLTPTGNVNKFFGYLFKYWPLHNIAQFFYKTAIQDFSASYDNKLQDMLSTINYNQDFTSIPISCDYHFFNLSMTTSNLLFNLNASFYLTNNSGMLSPVLPPIIIPNFRTKNSLRIQVTEYFFNSMLWAMFASNSLNLYISSSQVPKTFPYAFTTTGLNKIIPGLSNAYGPGLPVNLDCSVYKIPDVNIQSSILVYMSFYCDFDVMIAGNVGTTAFRLLGQISTSFTGEVDDVGNNAFLFGSFDDTQTNFNSFTVVNSGIGNFDPSALQQAFNWEVYAIVMQLNKMLNGQGMQLPIPSGISLVNPQIQIYPGALEIGAEVTFS